MSKEKQVPQSLPMLCRNFALRAENATDGDNAPVPLSFSSDSPIARRSYYGMWWNEVLGHEPGEVRTGRLDQGLTLLVNHDADQRAGRLDNGEISDGKGRGDAFFGTTDFAKTTRQEVDDKTLRYVSVGYIVNAMERVADADASDDEDEDYLGTYRVTDWEPIEVSLVAVPADTSVGLERGLTGSRQYPVRGLAAHTKFNPAMADKREVVSMAVENETKPAAAPAPTEPTREQLATEMRELDAIHSQYPEIFTAEKRSEFFSAKRTAGDAKIYVLDEMSKRSEETAARPNAEVIVDVADKGAPGTSMARFVRSIAATRGHGVGAAQRFAQTVLKDPRVARALGASTLTAGGVFVPEDISSEVIELLRPASIVRSLNPTLAPMPNGSLTMRKVTRGTNAQYIGENRTIPKTEMETGATKLSAKKLAAIVPISNDLLRFASNSADTMVRDDLTASISQKEDISFIRATGGEFSPRGLRWLAAVANILPVAGDASLANVTIQLSRIFLALRRADTPMTRPGIIMSPRTEFFLMNLRDGNGNFAYRAEMLTGKLNNVPYKVTTQLPENLGAGTESEIILADFADVLVGDVPAIEVETSGEATYTDSDGTMVSAFANDQTVIRMIVEHDINVKRNTSVAVLTGVTWGA